MSKLPQVPEVTDAQPITLEIVSQASPVMLANQGFVATLTKIEREVDLLVIDDATTQQYAAETLQRLTKAGTSLDTARLAAGEPFRTIQQRINDACKPVTSRIDAAKKKLSGLLTTYNQAQIAKAKQEEADRQAEIARQAAIVEQERKDREEKARVLEEQAAAQRAKDAEALAKSAAPVVEVDGWDDEPATPPPVESPPPKTQAELTLQTLQHAPAAPVKKAEGVRYIERLIYTVDDVNKLPEPLVIRTENSKAIRAAYVQGWKEGDPIPTVAGITFKIDRQVISGGRSVF